MDGILVHGNRYIFLVVFQLGSIQYVQQPFLSNSRLQLWTSGLKVSSFFELGGCFIGWLLFSMWLQSDT